jgi:Formate-dependent phosphoribosylglycinamide formyltransferase (GAR transformylase)
MYYNQPKILLLGSGELGKELVISVKRLGAKVIACDSYDDAPAQQVADEREVFSMLDGAKLNAMAKKHQPDFIVPEIEAIATDSLMALEKEGYNIIPSARAAHLTMNRDRIRDVAHDIGLRTAKFAYAESAQELLEIAPEIGTKVVIKPVMSSSGKGQSVAHDTETLLKSWDYAMDGMRGDRQRVIVEEFIDFRTEITLLTVRDHLRNAIFCPPIGHVQEHGDYQYSWQPEHISPKALIAAQEMAKIITDNLGGTGIFGVEFFITHDDEVIFSELSPRPHDTGMVTMYTQKFSEFDLHARAILGLPIPKQ